MENPIKVKTIALTICLGLLGLGCSDKSEKVSADEVAELISHIRQDRDFKSLQEVQELKMQNMNSERFSFSNIDQQMIKRESENCKSKEDFVELYRKAGMENSGEYFDMIDAQVNAVSQIARKYPQLKKLNEAERGKIFEQLFTISDSSVAKHISSKRVNNKIYIP